MPVRLQRQRHQSALVHQHDFEIVQLADCPRFVLLIIVGHHVFCHQRRQLVAGFGALNISPAAKRHAEVILRYRRRCGNQLDILFRPLDHFFFSGNQIRISLADIVFKRALLLIIIRLQ